MRDCGNKGADTLCRNGSKGTACPWCLPPFFSAEALAAARRDFSWKRLPHALRSGSRPIRRASCLVTVCLLLSTAGCPPAENQRVQERVRQGGAVRLAVAGDPAMAAAIEQLEGEWKAQTNIDLRVDRIPEAELSQGKMPQADALICPAYCLGPLAFAGHVGVIPQQSLEEDRENWADIFSTLWLDEGAWASRVTAVPFGSPVLVCYYRPDLLEKLHREPPRTWAQYQEVAVLASDRTKLGAAAPPADKPWSGAIEPLGPGWAGLTLLARAAGYATHPDNYSTLFNIDTMKPLVDGPPFVRALDELVAAAKTATPDELTYDPAAVRGAFWLGRCALAITWPTAADKSVSAEPGFPVGFAELPGSADVYDPARGRWEPRREGKEVHVALLDVAGRLGLLHSATSRPAESLRLLLWLSGRKWSPQVCAASPATTLFRQSHLTNPKAWVERPVSARAAAEYAQQTAKTLSGQPRLFALRIPGRAEYLAALDTAVQEAVRARKPSQDALRDAAAAWNKVTDRLGRRSQQRAYWASLGLE